MNKEIEERIKNWFENQEGYVDYYRIDDVCLDGSYNIKALAEVIIQEAINQERERIIEEIGKMKITKENGCWLQPSNRRYN